MIKLYLDCDGVILDTISRSYVKLKELGIDNEEKKKEFYRNINWDELIEEAGEIDNATNKIKKLIESNLFDISILTHVNSDNEAYTKFKYFKNKIPEVEVIPVEKVIQKGDYVNPEGCILVDDYLPNLEYWEEKGGIPVKFSDSGKESEYTTITDLLELIDIFSKKNIKIKK